MAKSMSLITTIEFIADFFFTRMGEDETLNVVLDKEKIPFLDISYVKHMFTDCSEIDFNLNKGQVRDCKKKVYFYSTEMQTIAGYSGHSIIITSGDMSNRAKYISMSVSIHKRWSRYIADLNNVDPVKCLHESVK